MLNYGSDFWLFFWLVIAGCAVLTVVLTAMVTVLPRMDSKRSAYVHPAAGLPSASRGADDQLPAHEALGVRESV
jgi:hypothetical protein